MNIINPTMIYENSYLHYSTTKSTYIDNSIAGIQIGDIIDVHVYLLDKRFLLTSNLEEIKVFFPYCKVIDLDDYYYKIISPRIIDKHTKFIELLSNNILININEFIKITG